MSSDLFYTNMYSIMYQWSDFRVSKNLYRAYFNQQKANSTDSDETETKTKTVDTSKLTNLTTDKLSTLTSDVTSAYSALKTKLEADDEDSEFDFDAAYDAASAFVNSYNDMVAGISKSGNSTVAGKASYINAMTSSYRSDLANIGITVEDDGTLTINEDTFKSASQSQLQSVFTDKNSFGKFINSTVSDLYSYSVSSSYTTANKTASTSSSSTSTTTSSTTYNSSGVLSELTNNSTSSSLLDYLV